MAGERLKEALKVYRKHYRAARRGERSGLLDELCALSGYHRKYAITLLSRADDDCEDGPRRRRGLTYSPAALRAVETPVVQDLALLVHHGHLRERLVLVHPNVHPHLQASLPTVPVALRLLPHPTSVCGPLEAFHEFLDTAAGTLPAACRGLLERAGRLCYVVAWLRAGAMEGQHEGKGNDGGER